MATALPVKIYKSNVAKTILMCWASSVAEKGRDCRFESMETTFCTKQMTLPRKALFVL